MDEPLEDEEDDRPTHPSGPLLPPEDRVWRHPSELSVAAPAVSTGHSWGTAAFSAVGGALAVGALWLAIGSDDPRIITERVSLAPIDTVSPLVVEADAWGSAVTATARAATVLVISPSGAEAMAGAVAIRDDGYLITSARSVADAESLVVVTADGVAHEASMVGSDPYTDISVIHTDQPPEVAVVSEDGSLQPGTRLAIVDPGGDAVAGTVVESASSVSTTDGDTLIGVARLDTELGSVPPGSPVVDETGAVVGITTATDPSHASAVVPIAVARAIAGDIIDHGEVRHPWLGVTARDITDDEFAGGRPAGAMVTSLTTAGPAAAGGVMPGDIIVAVGTAEIDSVPAMVVALRHLDPGDPVEILVERDGAQVKCSVMLGELEGAVS